MLIRFITTCYVFCTLTVAAAPELDPQQTRFFENKIRPVLAAECFDCHSGRDAKAGLRLDSPSGLLDGGKSGPAIVPGNPQSSLLLKAIRHEGKRKMPKDGPKLKPEVIAAFTKWIRDGAPDPRTAALEKAVKTDIDYEKGKTFWAFKPPVETAVPAPKNATWSRGALDRYVLARMEAEGLSPVAPALRPAWLRRVYFDLIGLPPTPEQLHAFLEDDSAEAHEKVVDELLDSPHFGERWGRHWLDVARYSESTGMERNFTYPFAWRYRDYVIKAFNDDKPFAEFLREQIAGDLIEGGSEEEEQQRLIATGFLAMGPKSLNERDKTVFNADVVDEQLDVTTRAAMALTVTCARCHDHKFDPVSQSDYYAMAGFFKSTRTYFGTGKGNGNRQASSLMSLGEDPEKDKARIAHEEKIAEKNRVHAKLNKELKQLRQQVKQDKSLQPRIKKMARQANQMKKALDKLRNSKPQGSNLVMCVQDSEKPDDSRIHLRGDAHKLGPEVPRGFLNVITGRKPELDEQESGRRQLADWLTDARHPLTARVMANRVWHWMFGQGIVTTVDNFGETGTRPSHPGLLDYLALSFVEQGWSVKKLVREIALSSTYRLSSNHHPAHAAKDPDNSYLWRMNHRRLDAESIRDAILTASGSLDPTPRKRSTVYEVGDVNVGRSNLLERINRPNNKRSVYLSIVRNAIPESLASFDFAEPSMVAGRRNVTTVPTQALYLMNSGFVLEQSKKLAARVIEQAPDPGTRAGLAYQLTLSRKPRGGEIPRAMDFIRSMRKDGKPEPEAWAHFCQSLLASAEFRYVE